MSVKGVQTRQLARQLTATALNCIISGNPGTCVGDSLIGQTFTRCNAVCAGLPDPYPDLGKGAITVGQCIGALDCYNNGLGAPVDDVCTDLPTNCHEQRLPDELLDANPYCAGKVGPAGSEDLCSASHSNSCYIFGGTCNPNSSTCSRVTCP